MRVPREDLGESNPELPTVGVVAHLPHRAYVGALLVCGGRPAGFHSAPDFASEIPRQSTRAAVPQSHSASKRPT